MLAYYARHFRAVEVNNTFYRLPGPEVIARWCELVPPGFRFAFKAPGAITHRKRFAGTGEIVTRFADLVAVAGTRLGPVLFQLDTVADVDQLAEFAALVKLRFPRIVFELRHPSWLVEPVFDLMRAHDVGLCQTETDDGCDPPLPAKSFAYARLRKQAYTAAELRDRLARLEALAAGGRDVFAFLKHDVENAVLLREISA